MFQMNKEIGYTDNHPLATYYIRHLVEIQRCSKFIDKSNLYFNHIQAFANKMCTYMQDSSHCNVGGLANKNQSKKLEAIKSMNIYSNILSETFPV